MTVRSRSQAPTSPMLLVSSTDEPTSPGRAEPPPPAITLLGGFRIDWDGREVTVPVGAQRLVALLALHGPAGRSRLAGMLWPDTTEQRALASLRTGIWRVNQAVAGLVVSGGGQVHLARHVAVDVHVLVARSVQLLDGSDLGRAALGDPFSREAFDDGLLPDWDDAWLTGERERLHQLRLHVLEALADGLAATGRFGLAIELALRALSADPLRESAHRTLVRIHLAEGNVHQAERALTECTQVLDQELGVAPTRALAMLLDHVRADRRDRDEGQG